MRQREYDTTRHNPIDTDKRNRHSSDGNKSDDLQRGKEMRHREHYVEWLSTQNVLDSMRYDDLRIPVSQTYPIAIRDLLMVGTHTRIP